MSQAGKKILIAGPAWVGDMVMAQSLFMTLQQQNPAAKIDVMAPSWSVPLLQRMPQVHRAIELPVGHKQLQLMTRLKLGRSLRANQYDQAIITPRSFKSALVPFFAGIPQRTGYRGEMRFGLINDMRRLDKTILRQTVQRYVALGLPASTSTALSVPLPELLIDAVNQQRLCESLQLAQDKPVIGFMPGAEYGPAKQWPTDYYQSLAEQLVEQGYRVWIFGSGKEQQLGEQIHKQNPQVINLCGKTELVDVVDLIALTRATVSNDSGLMHVACATSRPVIAIYGSSDPLYTPPLSEQATILYKNLSCSPCFDRQCRFGHLNCLRQITVSEALQAIQARL